MCCGVCRVRGPLVEEVTLSSYLLSSGIKLRLSGLPQASLPAEHLISLPDFVKVPLGSSLGALS